MRNPGGYGITFQPDSDKVQEEDTFTCCHCNCIVIVPPFKSPSDVGGWFCTMCDKPACQGCNGKGCTPFEKKLEAIERRDQLRRSIGV